MSYKEYKKTLPSRFNIHENSAADEYGKYIYEDMRGYMYLGWLLMLLGLFFPGLVILMTRYF